MVRYLLPHDRHGVAMEMKSIIAVANWMFFFFDCFLGHPPPLCAMVFSTNSNVRFSFVDFYLILTVISSLNGYSSCHLTYFGLLPVNLPT